MSHTMAGYGFVPASLQGTPVATSTPPPTASSSATPTSSRPISTMTIRATNTTASGAPLSAVALVAAGAGPPGGMPGTPTTLMMHPGANPDGSLFHQCAALLDRFAAIPSMQAYLDYATTAIGNTASGQPDVVPVPSLAGGTLLPGAAAAATAATAADAPSAIAGLQRSDPVTLLWTMLRVGEPLALLFNLAVPDHPIELASGKLAVHEGQMLPDRDGRCTAPSPVYLAQALSTLNSMKAMVYHTIVGLRTHNPQVNILSSIDADLFTIGELYQDDTSGFLKVLRTVRLVLDWLERAGRIQAPVGGGGGSPVTTTAPDAPPMPVITRRPSRMQLFTGAMASSVRGSGGTRTSDGSSDELFSPTVANGAPDRSSSGSTGPAAPPKELTHREKILIEMLQTERKYVADLERLHTYQQHLSTNNVLPPGTISALFSNLKALVDFQRGFLVGLESLLVQAAAGDEKVGSLFVSLEPTFAAVYAPFCANFKQASDLAVDNVHVLQAAAQVMEPQHELPSYLIKPIQRICRYPLLLRELIKKTPAEEYSEALAQDLQDGLEAIQRVTESVNEARRMHENQLVKEDLARRVEDWKGHDVNSFGSLLLHDRFMMQIQDYERELVIFLFDKIILCCKMLVAPAKQSGGGSTAAALLKRKSRGKSQTGSTLANASILSSAASIMTSATGGGGDVSFSVSSASGADGSGDGVTYQIKGRIWIGGITDLNGGEVDGSWLLTVSWKSPAKIEFFTLRCRNDEQFRLWLSTIQRCVEETRERGRARMLAQQQQAQQQLPPQQQRSLSSRLANIPQPILTSPPTSFGTMSAPTPLISQAPLLSPRPDVAGFGAMTPTVPSGAMSRPPTHFQDDGAEGDDNDARSFVERDADEHDQDNMQYPSTVTQGNGSGLSTSRFAPVAYRNPPSYDEFSASEYSSRKSSASSGISGAKSTLDAQLAELSLYARNGGGEYDDAPQRAMRQPPRVPLPTPPQAAPPSGPPPMRTSHVPPSANELPPRTASANGPPLPPPIPASQSSGQQGIARNDRSRSRDAPKPSSRRSPSVPRMPPPPTMPPPEMSLPPVPGPPPKGPPVGPPPPLPPMTLTSPPPGLPPAIPGQQQQPQPSRVMSSPAPSGGSSSVVGPPPPSGSSPSLGHAHLHTSQPHRSASPAAAPHQGSAGLEPQGPSQAYITRRRSSLANSLTATSAQSQQQHPSLGTGSPANSASPVLSAVNATNRGSRASSSLSNNNDARPTPTLAPGHVQVAPPSPHAAMAELPNTPPEVAPPPRIRNGANTTNPLDQGLMLTDASVSSEDEDMLGSDLGMSELSELQDGGQLQLLPPGSVGNTASSSARRPSASSGSAYRGLRLQMPPTLSTLPTGAGTGASAIAGGPKSAPPVVEVPSRSTSIGVDHQAVAREGSEAGLSTSPNVQRSRTDSESSYQSRGRSGTLQSMNDDNGSVVSSVASAVSAMSGSTAVAAIPEHSAMLVARERERSRSQSRSRSQTRQAPSHRAVDRSRSRSRSQSRTRGNRSQHPRALAEATGEEMPDVPELPVPTAAVVPPSTASNSNSPAVGGAQRHTYVASHAASGISSGSAASDVGTQSASSITTRALSMAAPGITGQALPPMPNSPARVRRPRSPSPLPPGKPSSPGIEVVKCKVYHSGHVYVLLAPRGTTYSGLVAQIKRKIGRTAAEIRIKYEDAEGDYTQISSDDDLGTALDVALRRSRKMTAGMPTSVASNPVMLEMFVFDV